MDSNKLIASALRRLEVLNREESFDPNVPESRPTVAQQEIIDDFGTIPTQWVVASNRSGKSQTCARLVAWAVLDKHPTWRVPQLWKDEGLLILVAAKNSKQAEESLWTKISSYLTPGTYKVFRNSSGINKVEVDTDNPEVKHRILFQSMESVDQARERVQSYDAHIVWADELIDSAAAISELRLRVVTKSGFFLCSFTPLKPSPAVKKLVDGAALPHAKRYNLKTLDNPVFKEAAAKEKLLATFIGSTAAEIATRLEGAWAAGESHVYHFDFDSMVRMPPDYSPMWRHMESIDPAMSSSMGLTVWAEDPKYLKWYCVLAKYVNTTKAPSEVVRDIQQMTSRFNIIRRVADTHEVWYIREAALAGIQYMGVYKKTERKGELIRGYQEKLGNTIFLTEAASDLIEETQECKWSEKTEGKIVNGSSYHLLDSAQYFCDNIPKVETSDKIQANSWQDWLYQANRARLVKEETEKAKRSGRRLSRDTRNVRYRITTSRWQP